MFSGLTVQEQRVLIVLLIVIGLGLAVQQFQAVNAGDAIELIQNDAIGQQGGGAEKLALKLSPSRPPVEQRASRRLNINTASEQELASGGLYRIGPARARAIVDYRNVHGAFRSLGEIENVPGIGPKTLEGIRDHVTVGEQLSAPSSAATTTALSLVRPLGETFDAVVEKRPPARININQASAEELTQLKGVGPVIAQEIIAYRRTHGPFRRPEDLMKVKGIKQKKFDELRQMIKVVND